MAEAFDIPRPLQPRLNEIASEMEEMAILVRRLCEDAGVEQGR
jgi:hypothetical protein